MRTRPREVVRMLAAFRHSSQCRTLRAAKAREALSQAQQEEDDAAQADDETTRAQRESERLHRTH